MSVVPKVEGGDIKIRFILRKLGRDLALDAQRLARLPRVVDLTPKRVLIVAPHMDDEVIGCGGLVQRYASRGAHITVCFLTDGASGFAPDVIARICRARRDESAQAASILGIHERRFLDIPERDLASAIEDPGPLQAVIEDEQPDVILVTSPFEYHPDHRAAFTWLGRALAATPLRPTVLAYEIWGNCRPDRVLPLEEGEWLRKEAAMDVYETQLAQMDYAAVMRFLGKTRGKAALPDHEGRRAETFRCWPAETVIARSQALDEVAA